MIIEEIHNPKIIDNIKPNSTGGANINATNVKVKKTVR
jgi:hypothetical protein